jgi:hypothetical protein
MCTNVLKVGIDSSQTTFYQALAATKIYKKAKGTGEKFKVLLNNSFVARGCYIQSFLESLGASIYKLAVAIFKTAISATTLFFNKRLRDDAIHAWKDLGETAETVAKSLVGIIVPRLARLWHHREIAATHQTEWTKKSDKQREDSNKLLERAGCEHYKEVL